MFAWVYVSKLKSEIETNMLRAAKKVELVSDIKTSVLTFRLAERGILLFSSINGQEKVQLNKDLFAQSTSKTLDKVRDLRPLLVLDEGRRLTDAIESGVNDYARIQTQIPKMCAAGQVREPIQMDMDRLVPVGGGIVKAIDALLVLQQRLNQEAV